MNVEETRGARFATWWVEAITRTAEHHIAHERRAEIASDVHEQLTDAWSRGLQAGSRSVIARVVRGMPADVTWRIGLELRRSRFAWHLRNPSTAITTLFVVMVPINVAAETHTETDRSWLLFGYLIPFWGATILVAWSIMLFALLALATRIRRRWTATAERFQPPSRLERARRRTTAGLGVALAGSAAFRFGALSLLGGVFWFAFAGLLLVYAGLLITTFGAKLLTLGRYLPKVGT